MPICDGVDAASIYRFPPLLNLWVRELLKSVNAFELIARAQS